MIKLLQLDERTEVEWADRLEEFEASFSYPLGEGRTFRISHGKEYGRFYRAMGVVRTIVASMSDRVVGAVSGVSREILLPKAINTRSVYLGDLKIRNDAPAGRVLLKLLESLRTQFAEDHQSGFGIVMRGTNVVPSDYTGRLGIPQFEHVGEVSILRIPTDAISDEGDNLADERGELDDVFVNLTHGSIAAPPGDASLRSRFEPISLCTATGDACGLLEDTLIAKQLFDSDGAEMLSAHLSSFAFSTAAAGARVLKSAICHARQRGLPALFVAVPGQRTDELLNSLAVPATTRTSADIYAHRLPTNHDWYVNTSEI
ncbi:MAG: N-acetyltransferase [Limisphaerales bacterium]